MVDPVNVREKMARRDNSQGFGFVYFDLSALLGKNKDASEQARDSAATGSYSVPHVNFPKPSAPIQIVNTENTLPPVKEEKGKEIREKLDRLQALHHKLHVMLDDVDKLTKKKK